MTSSTEEPSPIAVRAAAEHFIRALRMTAGIARTARVETTLMVVPKGGLFTADLTLAQLWPKDGAPPAQEVIWSHPDSARSWMTDYPAASFIRFYQNHRLLKIDVRPTWRTVKGGSRTYVARMIHAFAGQATISRPVTRVARDEGGATVYAGDEGVRFDHVVLAAHSDQALALIERPTSDERRLLGAIRYRHNRAVLHRDPALMPRRAAAWAAWNHIGRSDQGGEGGVTYWMNRLQDLPGPPLFVSLNPVVEPDLATVILDQDYEHPLFDAAAICAQRQLWSLQGVRRTWFCGAYFGWGFHEDGLQAGLAVAEQLGGVRRPWQVEDESGRIHLSAPAAAFEAAA